MAKFYERLNEAIRLRNMKQLRLAELTDIHVGTINNYLKGKYEPKQDKLYMISKALNVSPVWLMGYDVPMERENDLVIQDKKVKVNRFINELDEDSFNKLEDFLTKFFDYSK